MNTRQTTTSVSGALPAERVLRLLQHEHRRAIITYFDQVTTNSASVDDFVDYIVTLDSKRNGAELTTRRQRVTIGLLHNHLPRLADAGVLEYDQRSETIRYHRDDEHETLVEVVQPEENTM